ncbi:hypothetical protein O2U01_09875 (plasmid) [Ligilactobacillus salivarius]|nr:hypothetical protein [Ligilactobacillus salivarius]WHS07048.1 hypothetical protein O2U07_11225 [Ligilactobacillus salivarius]WHS08977.1 hypothetical protein O2U05_10225 [Ligilactobacillus salivarius]WHS21306.1 hypothetical protein O2U01_09875 [Ligilactobacillus salivarius]WNB34957.1 hypothetical protein O2U09_09310 [Ligilactobacillus salivarius]
MEKTKKLQLEDFTENEFFGTQEQQYLKAQVREERFCCKVLNKE